MMVYHFNGGGTIMKHLDKPWRYLKVMLQCIAVKYEIEEYRIEEYWVSDTLFVASLQWPHYGKKQMGFMPITWDFYLPETYIDTMFDVRWNQACNSMQALVEEYGHAQLGRVEDVANT
jgi:hypothetical protein